MNREAFDIPVVVIVYNRPEFTRQVISALRAVSPRRVFIIADGPDPCRSADAIRCNEVKAEFTGIDWPGKVELNASSNHLGCRNRIESGLTWVFENVQQAIILEDDCIPDPSFFKFCHEMLSRYQDEPRVLTISGMSVLTDAPSGPESYYFSIHPNLHGWAAWRRTWELYEHKLDSWPSLRSTNWLQRIVGNRRERILWSKRFDLVHCGFDAWDYALVYSCWRAGGYAVRPRHDLVRNIGFGPDATHTFDPRSVRAKSHIQPIAFPIIHPKQIDDWRVVRDRCRQRIGLSGLSWRKLSTSLRDWLCWGAAYTFGPANRSGRLRRVFRSRHELAALAETSNCPQLGTTITFTGNDALDGGLVHGWSYPERTGRWTDGIQASIVWRVSATIEGGLVCCVHAAPALHHSHPNMRVDIFVNDERCAATRYGSDDGSEGGFVSVLSSKLKRIFQLPAGRVDRFLIPHALLGEDDLLVMTFVMRWPLVPAEHGISDDFRGLGLLFRSIHFEGQENKRP